MENEINDLCNEVFTEDFVICDEGKSLLEEGITYYNLRQFVTLMINFTNDNDTKKNLKEILIILTKMEILNKPIPSIRKLKSASPEIF
jgi:hypothetical protein